MQIKDLLKLHFIVLIFGFTAILGKLISIPAVETVVYRTGITASAIFLILLFTRKHELKTSGKKIVQMLAIGGIVGFHWMLFFGATKVASVSICLIGMSTTSLWTAILEPLITEKKFSKLDTVFGVIIMGGLYIVFRAELDSFLGLIMGIGAAFLGSLFSVINSNLAGKIHHFSITLFEMMGAFLVALLFLPFYVEYFSETHSLNFNLQPLDWIWILILALVCTVYAYSASVEIMKRLTAFTVNLAINLEPIYGIIMAIILFPKSETMSSGFYLGTIIILGSVLLYPSIKKRSS